MQVRAGPTEMCGNIGKEERKMSYVYFVVILVYAQYYADSYL